VWPMLAPNDPGSYEVRHGTRSALLTLWLLVVPVLCIGVGIWKWPENMSLLFVGLAFFGIAVLALRVRIRGVLRRGTIVAIDSRGVFLGADLYGRTDEWESWSSIDAVVHFGGRRHNESGFRLSRIVGVVASARRVVAVRRTAPARQPGRLSPAGRPSTRP
jgi:hypothetical protein